MRNQYKQNIKENEDEKDAEILLLKNELKAMKEQLAIEKEESEKRVNENKLLEQSLLQAEKKLLKRMQINSSTALDSNALKEEMDDLKLTISKLKEQFELIKLERDELQKKLKKKNKEKCLVS